MCIFVKYNDHNYKYSQYIVTKYDLINHDLSLVEVILLLF